MKTTRRGWLTALSSLAALPLLPKSGSASASPPSPPRSLAGHFARLSYGAAPAPCPEMEGWEKAARVPVTSEDLRSREEWVRDSLHHQRAQGGACLLAPYLEAELRDMELAHLLLAHLPTGRPLTFRYDCGRSPGQARTVLPTLVFHTHDSSILLDFSRHELQLPRQLYLQAYCLERLAPRTFRFDRIQNLRPLG